MTRGECSTHVRVHRPSTRPPSFRFLSKFASVNDLLCVYSTSPCSSESEALLGAEAPARRGDVLPLPLSPHTRCHFPAAAQAPTVATRASPMPCRRRHVVLLLTPLCGTLSSRRLAQPPPSSPSSPPWIWPWEMHRMGGGMGRPAPMRMGNDGPKRLCLPLCRQPRAGQPREALALPLQGLLQQGCSLIRS